MPYWMKDLVYCRCSQEGISSGPVLRYGWIPYFGICLGMQMAVVEYARNLCGLAKANSSEFAKDD